MKKIVVLSKTKLEYEEKLKGELVKQVQNYEIVFLTDLTDIDFSPELIVLWDYRADLSEDFVRNNSIIRVHPSLLPAFNTEDAIKDAYMSGVKVSGVTVNRVEKPDLSGIILAQYPVIIDCYTHYDKFESEIKELELRLTPFVIKSVIEDKVFDIVDYLSGSQTHSCSGCGGCGRRA